LVRVELTFLPL